MSIQNIPAEISTLFLSRGRPRDLARCKQVCRLWKALLDQDFNNVWQKAFVHNYDYLPASPVTEERFMRRARIISNLMRNHKTTTKIGREVFRKELFPKKSNLDLDFSVNCFDPEKIIFYLYRIKADKKNMDATLVQYSLKHKRFDWSHTNIPLRVGPAFQGIEVLSIPFTHYKDGDVLGEDRVWPVPRLREFSRHASDLLFEDAPKEKKAIFSVSNNFRSLWTLDPFMPRSAHYFWSEFLIDYSHKHNHLVYMDNKDSQVKIWDIEEKTHQSFDFKGEISTMHINGALLKDRLILSAWGRFYKLDLADKTITTFGFLNQNLEASKLVGSKIIALYKDHKCRIYDIKTCEEIAQYQTANIYPSFTKYENMTLFCNRKYLVLLESCQDDQWHFNVIDVEKDVYVKGQISIKGKIRDLLLSHNRLVAITDSGPEIWNLDRCLCMHKFVLNDLSPMAWMALISNHILLLTGEIRNRLDVKKKITLINLSNAKLIYYKKLYDTQNVLFKNGTLIFNKVEEKKHYFSPTTLEKSIEVHDFAISSP